VLAAGFVASIWIDAAGKRWARLAPAIWWLAFLAAYSVRLPVTYQHGRYAMPAIPVLLLLGAEVMFTSALRASGKWSRLLTRAWIVAAVATAVAFLVPGGQAYGQDVAIIETEMVAPARWIAAHTERGDLIAAHDIGAVGYFSDRTLIDLAGLISPEVIPFMRDEARLAASYQGAASDDLPAVSVLVAGRVPVYVDGGVYRREHGRSPQPLRSSAGRVLCRRPPGGPMESRRHRRRPPLFRGRNVINADGSEGPGGLT
jgi:hypothetical protein